MLKKTIEMRKAIYVVNLCFLVIGVLFSAAPVFASKKVALVIGNDHYQNVPGLEKAISDASTIASVLSQTGFEVLQANDASRRATNQKIHEFISRVDPGDVAMFYYAGHGVEIRGQNYLLPVDVPSAEPGQEGFVKAESISLTSILERLREKHARLNIVVLDACRNNPFKSTTQRGVGSTRGLAAVTPPKGTFILYSADAGEAALDALSESDTNPNSVFTRVLAPLISKPDIDLVAMAREVRRQVRQLASSVYHEQTPAYYDAVLGDFYFARSGSLTAQNLNVDKKVMFEPANLFNQSGGLELAFWREVQNSKDITYLKSYIKQYPEGKFVYLAKAKINVLKQKEQQENSVAMVSPPAIANLNSQLQLCDDHFKTNRLTTGNGGNAYDCYTDILRGIPDNQVALAGVQRIEDKYAGWARKYLIRGDKSRAKMNIEKLRGVNPNNMEIQGLLVMLKAQRHEEPIKKVSPATRGLIAGVYEDNGDGTLTDVRTGLQWMRCSVGQSWNEGRCRGEAESYSYGKAQLEGSAKNGKKGGAAWRVPSRDELLTLVVCSSGQPSYWNKTGKRCEGDYQKPTINTEAFPETLAKTFWSSSKHKLNQSNAWYADFKYGYSNISELRLSDRFDGRFVRLVRIAVKEKPKSIDMVYRADNSINDAVIKANINKAILADHLLANGAHIITTVLNGVVLLTGEVDSEKQKTRVSEIANSSQGVNNTVNKIDLLQKSSLISRFNDTLISGKIKTELTRDKGVASSNIKVVTVRGIVYLMGVVTPPQGEVAVELAKQIGGVVRIVKIFMVPSKA